MKYSKLFCIAIFATLNFGHFALAQRMETPQLVSTAVGGQGAGAPSSGMLTRSAQKTLTVRIHNSCFATNLRGVANPLAPSSIIHANMTLNIAGNDVPIAVAYPADLVTAGGLNGAGITITPMDASKFTLPTGSSASIYANTVALNIPVDYTIRVNASGEVSASSTVASVKDYSFVQEITDCSGPPVYGSWGISSYTPTIPCGAYMGQNGTLSASVNGLTVAADNSVVELNVDFPGQTGFCGGFYSPLMVFFDEKRPLYSAISEFPLNPSHKTYWPEAGAPGAILVWDRKGDGKISAKDQLFGDQSEGSNGFEALRKLDSNRDGWITAKDSEFKNIKLWRDRGGDGISQDGEVVPLSALGIVKISLQYKHRLRPIGHHAEEREVAEFWFRDTQAGKMKKGMVVDIWLSPATERRPAALVGPKAASEAQKPPF